MLFIEITRLYLIKKILKASNNYFCTEMHFPQYCSHVKEARLPEHLVKTVWLSFLIDLPSNETHVC